MRILRFLPILAAPLLILTAGCDRNDGNAPVESFGNAIRELKSWAKAKEAEKAGNADFNGTKALLSEMTEKMQAVDTKGLPEDLASSYANAVEKTVALKEMLYSVENEQELSQRMMADPAFGAKFQKVTEEVNRAYQDLQRVASTHGLQDLDLDSSN